MKKIAYALLAVMIAVGLWSYVIAVESPEWEEIYYDIPVVLENETILHGRNLMITSEDVPKVTLKLKGNRSAFTNLSKDNITLVADLAKVYSAGAQRVAYSISFPSNSFEVVSQSPQEIELTITERASKDVPVELVYDGKVPDGYQTDKANLTLDYHTVRVTGPASVINKITSARVQVDLEGQTETINQSYAYTLCDKSGEPVDAEMVNTNVTEVTLNLKIQRYKEVTLLFNPIYGGGATIKNTLIELDMTSIQVSGTEQQLKDVGSTLNLGDVRLYEILGDADGYATVELPINLPEGVENLAVKNTATVSIQFQGLTTATITVTNIVAKNVPQGLEATVIAKQLDVVVRGPKEQVDAMSADALTVHVDFSNAEVGQDTYMATVFVDSGIFGDVGAVGSYNMLGRVSEAEETNTR